MPVLTRPLQLWLIKSFLFPKHVKYFHVNIKIYLPIHKIEKYLPLQMFCNSMNKDLAINSNLYNVVEGRKLIFLKMDPKHSENQ